MNHHKKKAIAVPVHLGKQKSTHNSQPRASHFGIKPKETSPPYPPPLLGTGGRGVSLVIAEMLPSQPATHCMKKNCLQSRHQVRQGKNNV
ncbi:hypothetical protein NG798_00160 [Ancylothrix sp. C2]|uniref:hypothetical protein n=1 Tax=Ancylothrix sp. D3o TaxID=2953691 RepID=UPI0021BA7F93|nr:hypothetical protein [Ancylothrix sp. D3o]MCT7948204.1 hypothetical protein [Ancylothrix sp. D3o]